MLHPAPVYDAPPRIHDNPPVRVENEQVVGNVYVPLLFWIHCNVTLL